jgi:5'(3')-deoxyribonucleotidase
MSFIEGLINKDRLKGPRLISFNKPILFTLNKRKNEPDYIKPDNWSIIEEDLIQSVKSSESLLASETSYGTTCKF